MPTPRQTPAKGTNKARAKRDGSAPALPSPTRSKAIKQAISPLAAGLGIDLPKTAETRLPELDTSGTIRAMARELGMLSRSTNLFARNGVFLTVDAATGDTKLMTGERFCSWVETIVWPMKITGTGPQRTRLGLDLARQILACDEFAAHVRPLREVRTVRLPVFRADGKPSLLPAGYDDTTGVFTVDSVPYDEHLDAGEAQQWMMQKLLPFYPWADVTNAESMACSRCVAAHLAGMLTPFCSLMLPDEANRPMFVYLANQKGAGKSALAKMLLAPVYGFPAATNADTKEQELENQIASALLAGKPYLFLDNMKNFRSGTLAMVLTSPRVALRVLGKPDMPELVNKTLFVLTGISVNIGDELLRRSVIVDLFSSRDATARRFDPDREITDAWFSNQANRSQLLACLWAFVRHWTEQGMKRYPEAHRATFEACAALVGSVVLSLGMANPFAPRAQDMGGDEEGESLVELAKLSAAPIADKGARDWKPGELVELAEEHGLLDLIVPYAKQQGKALGQRLRTIRGREYQDHKGRWFQFGDKHRTRDGHGAFYRVRILG